MKKKIYWQALPLATYDITCNFLIFNTLKKCEFKINYQFEMSLQRLVCLHIPR